MPKYYPELGEYQGEENFSNPELPLLTAVGWLVENHPYPKGNVSDAFIKRLWVFCKNEVYSTYGACQCPFCGKLQVPIYYSGEAYKYGGAEIRVIGKDGKVYAAPNMIFHYVIDHLYQPPEEFIQAVLEGPLPDSKEYQSMADKYDWFP